MKILLVDPPGANKGLNTGLAYLVGAIGAAGRDDAFVLDLNNRFPGLNNRVPGRLGDPNPDVPTSVWLRELEETLDQFAPDLVGVSVKTFTSTIATQIIAAIRRMRPSSKVVVGGPHVTIEGAAYLAESGADIAVLGEGEFTLLKICRALEHTQQLGEIDGVLYRQEGHVTANERRGTLCDPDALPFPDYQAFSSVRRSPGILHEYPLLTSRGCPYNCSYCSMPVLMGRRWRARSPENVVDELRMAVERVGCTSFTIVDDNFTLDTKRAEAICDAIIANGLSMPWTSQNGLRADRLTPTLIAKMRQSGCHHVWIGIETGDDAVFQSIDKGEKLEDVKAGVRALQAQGIKVGGFFIVGLPGSTRESDLRSLSLAQELGIEAWWFNFVPYRFTRAGDWVREKGTMLRTPDGTPQYGRARIEPVFETPTYSREERMATYEEVHVRMGYFDRLIDPDMSRAAKTMHLLKSTPKYGVGPTLGLTRFVATRFVQGVSRKLGQTGG